MKTFIVSLAVFGALCAAVVLAASIFLMDLGPRAALNGLYTEGKLFLFRNDMIHSLSTGETARLYRATCTRKCHSKDVIEKRARTAPEWEWIVTRMKGPDRAGMTDRHARTIARYLQKHFLSNVPTFLPEKTMRFVRRHLWQSDFGADDLYLDVIYVPDIHTDLLPYLVVSNSDLDTEGTVFVVFLNTHQGAIPPWSLAETATLRNGGGTSHKAVRWEVLYEDGQNHHKQGILSFPAIDETTATTLEVAIALPGMRKKVFQWELPVPAFREMDNASL